MTNNELLHMWTAPSTACNYEANSLSIRGGTKLYSYALQIGERFNAGRLALLLPYGSSSATTNKHISEATQAIHSALGGGHVFNVPVLDPASLENIQYFLNEAETAKRDVFNTRRLYKNRVLSILHYYRTHEEILHYLEATGANHVPEVAENIIESIEHAGDLKFLGWLGLEGEACKVHEADDEYRAML